jgi:hypothetical protein
LGGNEILQKVAEILAKLSFRNMLANLPFRKTFGTIFLFAFSLNKIFSAGFQTAF